MTTASPAVVRDPARLLVGDPQLQPQASRADGDGLAGVLDAQVRATEHVDDVDGPGRRDGIRHASGSTAGRRSLPRAGSPRRRRSPAWRQAAHHARETAGRGSTTRRRARSGAASATARGCRRRRAAARETGPRRSRSAPPRGPVPRHASPSASCSRVSSLVSRPADRGATARARTAFGPGIVYN